MLHQFLELIWAGDVQSLLELSKKLNISQEMVLQMAKDLTIKGYLQEIGSDCNLQHESCPDCPVNTRCQPAGRHWFLTEKGRTVVGGRTTPA